ncbi:hypothetical protein [Gordonia insulae]|uniref:Uncharacterized protein n=1 Tax=Gordonia insulae TaxID=2420509 RepID=A0A3G8JK62_9ACTN|nr:hypothetical protein [Gordonia insulae]AZG45015.1 hypothetical protein D7316_01607 [Gordonia insulae]
MGRRNREQEPAWSPQNAAKIRAGLAFGLAELARDYRMLTSELEPDVDALFEDLENLDPSVDDAERDRLDELGVEAMDTLDAYDANAALATVEGELVGGSGVIWVDRSAMAAIAAEPFTAESPEALLPDVDCGIALFEIPLGTYVFRPLDENGEPVPESVDLDIDGIFWWRARHDLIDSDGDEDPSEIEDFGGEQAEDEDIDDSFVFHILSRARNVRHHLHDAWRLPVAVDGASVVLPWSTPFQPDDGESELWTTITFFGRLCAAIHVQDRVSISEQAIPAAKQSFVKAGWPELEPVESVSVVSGS